MVGLLTVALAATGCRSTNADVVDPPTPPATTTTTTPDRPPTDDSQADDDPGSSATAADAGVAQGFFEAFSSGDADGWLSLMASDAVVVDRDERVGLFEPLPPDIGIPDWNDDGVSTVLDVILQQSVFALITGNDVDTVCVPDGPEVACTVNETDVFYRAAGIVAPTIVQWLTVRNGLIIEIGGVEVAGPAAADVLFGAWVEQFGNFEAWVDVTYPERFDALFRAPCCVGAPETLNLIPGTADELAVLFEEWSSGLG